MTMEKTHLGNTTVKTYLGDSVYLEIIPGAIVLTTENGEGASNRIVLETDVWRTMLKFVEKYDGVI